MSSDSTPTPYRQVQPTGDSEKQLQSDKKILQIKCSKSNKLFQTYLIRDPGAKQFRVVAFEPFPERAVMTYSPANSLFARLVKVIGDWLNRARATAKPEAEPLDSGQDDGAVLYLGIQDIDWSGHDCPDCHSQKPNRSGSSITWLQCGHCSNIFCVGNLESERFIFVCPWCGNRGQLSTQQTSLNAPAKPKLLAKVQSPPKTTGPRALPPGHSPKQLPPPKDE